MKKIGFRWLVVSLVALATVINYIDRGTLGILWPEISKDLGMTKTDYAIILNVFTFAYAFGQTLFGKIFDWIGVRLGFILSITVWSVATLLHAAAAGLTSFALFRGILGLSEAGNWPGATKANAEWFPIKERALAQGIFNSGAAIGGIISAPIIAYLFVFLESWQATFIVLGALGLLWLVPWLIVYKSGPDKHPWVSEAEREYILNGQRSTETTTEVAAYEPNGAEILSRKESWGVILASFFLDPIWWLFVGWLPLYLSETYGFGVAEIGKYAWVPYVGAMFGAWFGGLLAQNRIKAGWTVNKVRKSIITLGGVIMLVALLMTMKAATPLVAVLLMAVILFGFQTAVGNIQTLPSDFYGTTVGLLAGFAGTAAKLAVVLLNFLIPVITVNSYAPAFAVGAGLAIMTVLSVWFLCGNIQRLSPRPAK